MSAPVPAATRHAIDQLRALPFVDEVEVREGARAADAAPLVALRTGRRWHVFRLVVVARAVDEALLAHLGLQLGLPGGKPMLVVARRLPRDGREKLRTAGIAYVDAAGNCFVPLGREHVAWVDGRRADQAAPIATRRRGLGVAGYQVQFALLAEPELLNRPVREIAAAAGVGKTGVADALERLRDEGRTLERGGQRRFIDRQQVLDEWLEGYRRLLRGRLLVGEFEAADAGDPLALEARFEQALTQEAGWALGGGGAAHRWTGHWRGELTVLHVAKPADDLPKRLKLLPARRGRVQILRAPFRAAIGPEEHLAHPLLVYAELLVEGHERAREAAMEVRLRFPGIFA